MQTCIDNSAGRVTPLDFIPAAPSSVLDEVLIQIVFAATRSQAALLHNSI